MSNTTPNRVLDLQEQICYVQCGYCTTILLVGVPCGSLTMVVTVRCGHCTSLLSVNMLKTSFIPLHLFASVSQDQMPKQVPSSCEEADGEHEKASDRRSPSLVISSDDDEEDVLVPMNHIVNRPPEKRQRAPSAYNNFIKEEIRRLKGKHPSMTHKEAFSAAAKNWAHFPPIQYKKGEVSCGEGADHAKMSTNCSDAGGEVYVQGNGFHERKAHAFYQDKDTR
uniref:Putative INNER NO OUTER-orthologous transcription factor MhyINO1 n=1 Tax=Monotropa hypopitys TaxID=176248 RepID=A0A1Q1N8R4_9ERIC|nr:putative INNER NO OUTER-orthologous transcription factor MhyINO1 [Monotropa hypopitys]